MFTLNKVSIEGIYDGYVAYCERVGCKPAFTPLGNCSLRASVTISQEIMGSASASVRRQRGIHSILPD